MDTVWKLLGYLHLLLRKILSISSPSLVLSNILILSGLSLLPPNLIFHFVFFFLHILDSEDINYVMFLSSTRSGEQACTAYVMFKDSYSQETAVLLSVSVIASLFFLSFSFCGVY